MNNVLRGFTDELTKEAALGVGLTGLARLAAKHPWIAALEVAPLVGGTAIAARRAYKRGLTGRDAAKYLPQRVVGNWSIPTPRAYQNFNKFFKKKFRTGKKSPSRFYRRGAFRRGSLIAKRTKPPKATTSPIRRKARKRERVA